MQDAGGLSDRYYITAAPQCVFPDAALGGVLNSASFDAVYGSYRCFDRSSSQLTIYLVQFYNNPCGLQAFDSASVSYYLVFISRLL